jgi:hypothetical protein
MIALLSQRTVQDSLGTQGGLRTESPNVPALGMESRTIRLALQTARTAFRTVQGSLKTAKTHFQTTVWGFQTTVWDL